MKSLAEERKAQMLVLFSEKPRTSRDCAKAMGLTHDQMRHLVTDLVRSGKLFRVGFINQQPVVSTKPEACMNANQERLLACLADGAKSGPELEKLLGLSVGRVYDALRNLREMGKVYVQSKVACQQFYAAGSEPDVVPKRRRKPLSKAQRIARIKAKEEKHRQQRLETFERQRLEGIAKNARMLPFAW